MKVRTFKTKKSKKFFFSFLSDDGQTIMKSIPFDSKPERDKAKKATLLHLADRKPIPDRNAGGKFGFTFTLNGKDIANTQEGFTTQAESDAAKESLYKVGSKLLDEHKREEAEEQDVVNKTNNSYKTNGSTDDYRPLSFYQSNGGTTNDGFDTFEAEGEFYFSYRKDGKIHLISEGYSSAKSR